jgi:Zn-finger nucleic acid-binding protein
VTTRCFFCATRGAPGTTCPSCRSTLPRIDARLPVGGCPRCGVPFSTIALAHDGAIAHGCTRCRGVFVPPRAWNAFVEDPGLTRIVEMRLPKTTQPISGAGVVPLLACPVCKKEMDRARFSATSSVVIDVCTQLHGMWLDGDELPAAVSYAEHRAKIGEVAAQAEAENQWARATGKDPEQVAIELERARIKAESAQRMWKAKRAAIAVGVGLLVLRLGFYAWRYREKKAEVENDQTPAAVENVISR